MENTDLITLPNDVNINLLNSQYSEHCKEALNQAMTILQAVEVPIQKFNTLGCITKDTYYKIMCHFKRRLHDNPSDKKSTYTALICLIDTLTCMIKERAFFEEYRNNIKHLLIIISTCMQVMQTYCNTDDLNAEQVGILLNLIKKFVERIKNHEQMDMSIIINTDLIIHNIKLTHDCKLKEKSEECSKSQKHKMEESNNNNNVNIFVNGANGGVLKDFSSKENIASNHNFCDITDDTTNNKNSMENKQKRIKVENIKLHTLTNNNGDTTRNTNNNSKSIEKINAFSYMMACSKSVFNKK